MPGNGFAIYDLTSNGPAVNMFEAAERGDERAITMFSKKRGFDINHMDRFGRSALMWASDCGHLGAVELLLRLGATVEIVDHHTGRSAMHWAARSGSVDIVKALKDCGADINLKDNFNLNPCYLASQRGQQGQEVFEYLIGEGAKYNEQADPAVLKAAALAAKELAAGGGAAEGTAQSQPNTPTTNPPESEFKS